MRARRCGRRLAASFLVASVCCAAAHAEDTTAKAPPAAAATPPGGGQPTGPGEPNPLGTKALELRGLQNDIEASDAKRRTLSGEIATLESDRARFQSALVETTRKVGDDEAKVDDAERKLDTLGSREASVKESLHKRQAVVAEVLAALQRMGRRPPPALLVAPDDVLRAIRTSMLLGTLVPGMRAETQALMSDLAELSQTRKAIEAERRALDADLALLAGERQRLSMLIEARQAAIGKAHGDMDAERDRAAKLVQEAGSLKELIAGMERASGAAAKAAEAARQSDEKLAMTAPAGAAPANPTPFKDMARLAPAIAFASAKGLLQRPVGGQTLRRFGEDDGLGSAEKGELFASRANAIVAAPADGWVAFAGPYRSYGKLLILNAGGGYYIVLAGMERINVDLGQFVVAGEPIAGMGDGSTKTAAAIALGAAQPILYVEFRKDGATIDPSPWWARPELQKVRG